jgi:hypothetical protein
MTSSNRRISRSFGNVIKSVTVSNTVSELPGASDGVDQLDVDFGAVECSLAGDGFVLDVAPLERLLERADGELPLIVASDIGLAVGQRPR